MVGGDFNMIRYVHEKSSGTDYTIWMDMFNCFINNTAMIEVIRGGSKFTWTNKQESPARSNLHRVLISREWKQKYPKVRVVTLTRIGSDHNPLLLDDGTRSDTGRSRPLNLNQHGCSNLSLKGRCWKNDLRRGMGRFKTFGRD
jgi:hypothetical protein